MFFWQPILTAKNRGSSQADTVGEFRKQRAYAFHSTEFKKLTQLRLNSPTVSARRDNVNSIRF